MMTSGQIRRSLGARLASVGLNGTAAGWVCVLLGVVFACVDKYHSSSSGAPMPWVEFGRDMGIILFGVWLIDPVGAKRATDGVTNTLVRFPRRRDDLGDEPPTVIPGGERAADPPLHPGEAVPSLPRRQRSPRVRRAVVVDDPAHDLTSPPSPRIPFTEEAP